MSEENVSLPVAQALASALEKIEAYVPTEYVDNSEPDIDAEHLNHAEQGIMRVTNLLNAAVDVIQGQESRLSDAETKVGTAALTGGMTDLSSGLNKLNSNIGKYSYGYIETSQLSGNSDFDVDISGMLNAINGTPIFFIPLGYNPLTTWDTQLTFKNYADLKSKKIEVRTIGTDTQKYKIAYILFATN